LLALRSLSALTAELRHEGGSLSFGLLIRYSLALTCLSFYLLFFTNSELLLVDVSIQIPEGTTIPETIVGRNCI